MAERAHPDDAAFRGTVFGEKLKERYQSCVPLVRSQRVLDVPCGTGWGTSLLEGTRRVCGVDCDETSISFAQSRYPQIEFLVGRMEKLPFEDSIFDTVLCLEGLEHVHRAEAKLFVSEAWRVLAPGGRLVITTPLRASKHSLNPYHLYEYTDLELRALLGTHFDIEQFERVSGGDGEEARIVAARRNQPVPPSAQVPPERVNERALEWLRESRHPDGGRFRPDKEPTVLASCWHVLTLEGLGQLGDLSSEVKGRWVEQLRGSQREDGVYCTPEDGPTPTHDLEYLDLQTGYFCLHALDALGEKPLRSPQLPKAILQEGAKRWLESLDWSNAWLQSNRVMFVLSLLIWRAEHEGDGVAIQRVHEILDGLETLQDPTTGFWGTREGASLLNGMAAAYHFLPFYRYAQRPLRMTAQMIDHVLALQQPDGLFGSGLGGGACEDLDAIDVLLCAVEFQPAEEVRVKAALLRTFWAIFNSQLDDGGFGYSARAGSGTYRFSGLERFDVSKDAGDAWSLWFRLSALHHLKRKYPEDLPDIGNWAFRRLPALGYHRWPQDAPARSEWFLARLHRNTFSKAIGDKRAVVVITNYNLTEYLVEAVRSVLSQDAACDLIVVDDGSDEQLAGVVLPLLTTEGIRVERVSRLGLPAARNHGIRLSDAQFIVCLDADDLLEPNHVSGAVEIAEATGGDVVAPRFACFDGAHHEIAPTHLTLPELLLENTIPVSALFRRRAWERVGGYDEEMSGMQDWAFWISIVVSGGVIAASDASTFRYRVRGGSMYSRTKKPERFRSLYEIILRRHSASFAPYLQTLVLELVQRLQEANGRWAAQAKLLDRQAAERPLLTYWRAEGVALATQVAELRSWIGQLEGAKAWLVEQNSRLEAELKRQAELLQHSGSADVASVEGSIESSATRADLLQRVASLEQLLAGESAKAAALREDLASSKSREAELEKWAAAVQEARDWHRRQSEAWRELHYKYDSTPLWRIACQRAELRVTRLRCLSGRFVQNVLGLPQPPNVLEDLKRWGWSAIQAFRRSSVQARPSSAAEVAPLPIWPDGEPLVSVVIPCFNYGRYVELAIDSVLRQTFQNLEVIVVDGGSTDGTTRAILQKTKRERVRVFLREGRHLVGNNRNFGIERARGRYICCLDADDQLSETYLETALYLLERHRFDVVSTSIQQFGDEHRTFDVAQRPTIEQMLEGNHIPTVAVFRRELWERAGGIHDFGLGAEHIYEDWCFWVRLCGLGARVHNIVESPQFLYRVHSDGSLSKQHGAVPPMEVQRARIRAYNDDLLREENRALFRAQNERTLINPEAFETLRDVKQKAGAGTLLITMPFLTVGGAEALMSSWCAHLAQAGWRLILLTTIPIGPEHGDSTPWFRPAVHEVYHLPRLLPHGYWLDWYDYLITAKQVDVLWQVGSPFTYDSLPSIKARHHDLVVVDLLFNTGVHAAANRRHSAWIDRHLCENSEVEKFLLERGADPRTVTVVRSGVDLEHYRPRGTDPEIRKQVGASADTVVVGFLGRMSEEKAPDVFLQVAREFCDDSRIAFLMTGAGPLAADVLEQIRNLGLENRVHHFGCVDDVRPYLGSCDLVMLPSRLDGRPTVVLQALAMGRPVIASRVGALPEILVDGETGVLCEPASRPDFVSALQGLLGQPERLAQMKIAARAFAERELDHRRASRQIESIFVDLRRVNCPVETS